MEMGVETYWHLHLGQSWPFWSLHMTEHPGRVQGGKAIPGPSLSVDPDTTRCPEVAFTFSILNAVQVQYAMYLGYPCTSKSPLVVSNKHACRAHAHSV